MSLTSNLNKFCLLSLGNATATGTIPGIDNNNNNNNVTGKSNNNNNNNHSHNHNHNHNHNHSHNYGHNHDRSNHNTNGNSNNNSNININNNGDTNVATPLNNVPSKNEPKNKRRKLQYTAERLRRMMLEWAFKRTGKPFKEEKIKRLGREHQEEKLQRYNYLCPKCDVMNFIVHEGYSIRNSIPLCIETCPNNPLTVKNLEDNLEWFHIKHKTYQKVSSELNNFVSIYVQRDKMSVVENTALTLKIQFTCMNQGEILTLCNQHWIVKVLKRLWFEKIRTSTPAKQGSTQPLNLTYGRFWVELIPDAAYMSITAHNTQREYQHIPIDSVIGATVDSSMQIYLSLQSSFESNTSKSGRPRHVSFDLYVKRQYMSRFQVPISVKITLTKNCSCPSHNELNDLGNFASIDQENSVSSEEEIVNVEHPNYELNAHSNNTLCLYSFKINNTELQNTFADNDAFCAIEANTEDHTQSKEKIKSISPQSDSSSKSDQRNKPEKRKRSDSIEDTMDLPNKRRKNNTNTDEWFPTMPLFISEEEKRSTMCSLPFYPLTPSFSQSVTNDNDVRIKIDSKESNAIPSIPNSMELNLRTENKNGSELLTEITNDLNNGQYNHLKKFCETYKILHFYEALKRLGCQTPEDVLNVLGDESKAHKIWKEGGCTNPMDQLAIISTLQLGMKGKEQPQLQLQPQIKTQSQPQLQLQPQPQPQTQSQLQTQPQPQPQPQLQPQTQQTLPQPQSQPQSQSQSQSQLQSQPQRQNLTSLAFSNPHINNEGYGNNDDNKIVVNTNGNRHKIIIIENKKQSSLPMYPDQAYQELMELIDEEKNMEKTYDKKYQEIKEKLQLKQSIAKLRKSWQFFLSQWTKWSIEDFHNYLINVEKQIMKKYFASMEDFKHSWYTTQKQEFVGSVLKELDRENLKELGIKDKHDRKILFQRLTVLRNNEKD